MATNKERFRQEIARITGDDEGYSVTYDGLDDAAVVDALVGFAKAADPDRSRPRLRKPRKDGSVVDADITFNTAKEYLQAMRLIHERGFDLLNGLAGEFNEFMHDMVDGELDAYGGSIQRTTASRYQSAARAFYRYCDEPGKSSDRPDTTITWPVEEIYVFSDQSEPRYDEADMFEDAEVDALRKACIHTRNSRRDRAFIELVAGTAQRIEALRTLRIKDVNVDADGELPHILLNPEIRNDGDKGAINNAGRYRPIVSDHTPIREFIEHHPLRDPDARARHDTPDRVDDCYLFVGDPHHPDTDASRPWDANAIRQMLTRLGDRAGVDKPVKPHNFRHFAYSKSKELPIDEGIRRKVFSWAPGSDTGETVYGHVETKKAGEQFAEEWAAAFGSADGSIEGVTEQIVGSAFGGDLSPEARQALARELVEDSEFVDAIADEIANAVE